MGKMSDLDLQIKELRSCGETILEIAEKMCIRDRVFAVEAAARHRIGHVAAQLPVGRAGVHIRAACPDVYKRQGLSFCPESEVQRAKETKTPLLLPRLSKPHGRAVL